MWVKEAHLSTRLQRAEFQRGEHLNKKVKIVEDIQWGSENRTCPDFEWPCEIWNIPKPDFQGL